MRFSKMNGLGNDYIYIDTMADTTPRDYNELAIRLSNRNFGIGADGIVLIGESEVADFSMRIINADGTEAEMCGNAIRCVAKYVFDNNLTTKRTLSISTLGGIKVAQIYLDPAHKVDRVRVNMGRATILNKGKKLSINTTKGIQQVTCATIGNPHAIIFVDNINDIDMEIGRQISENTTIFPERTNVEFLKIIDRMNASMRVYERGAGETLACGTGACASFYVAYIANRLNKRATIHLRGGALQIEIADGIIFMEGEAQLNYEGEIIL